MRPGPIVAAALGWFAAGVLAEPPTMRSDYQAAKKQITAEYRSDRAGCKRLTGDDQDLCEEKAEAKQKVAMAELDYNHSGKPEDAYKLAQTQAATAYAVAEEVCDAKPVAVRRACVDEARAVRDKALRDARFKRGAAAG